MVDLHSSNNKLTFSLNNIWFVKRLSFHDYVFRVVIIPLLKIIVKIRNWACTFTDFCIRLVSCWLTTNLEKFCFIGIHFFYSSLLWCCYDSSILPFFQYLSWHDNSSRSNLLWRGNDLRQNSRFLYVFLSFLVCSFSKKNVFFK